MEERIRYSNIFGNSTKNLVCKMTAVGSAMCDGKDVKISSPGGGIKTNVFFANSSMVKVKIDITADFNSVSVWICIIKTSGEQEKIRILDGVTPGKLELDFDAANYCVYSNAKEFYIVVDTNCKSGKMTVNNFEVCALEGIEQSEYYDSDFETMLKNLFDAVNQAKSAAVANPPVVVDPDGKKFTLSIGRDKVVFAIPNIPSKVVFIGNSLLLGMGSYGMCSTSPKNDYFYHVSQAILAENSSAEFVKLHGSGFESATNTEEFEKWWGIDVNSGSGKTVVDSLEPDTELVVIQLNDNVNTPEKVMGLKNNINTFVSRLRNLCPKARIIWVLGWYNKANSFDVISTACNKWNIPVVDISDLFKKENQGLSGQEYELPDGTMGVVKDGWITHPGNKGMKLIAERIVKAIDM